MKCFVGMGSNLGDRRAHLEGAARALREISLAGHLRLSPIYENPAMVPEGASADWRKPFLNAVAEIEFSGSPHELLAQLKKIEGERGRVPAERWAPRILDLDLLIFGDVVLNSPQLVVPHPGLSQRSFVLDPLKDLVPDLRLPGQRETVLQMARRHPGHAPLWMGILNLTPDSFSDGGELNDLFLFKQKIDEWDQAGVQIFDIGAESTRPGATPLSAEQEWERLEPALEMLRVRFRDQLFRPIISVDTRHASTAAKALDCGADWVNDVSGFAEPAMLELLKGRDCDAVFMHSLTIPADSKVTLPPDQDPVRTLKFWAAEKIAALRARGIPEHRLIFDPGLGFGKNANQSLSIVRRWNEFNDLPTRILVGHSRKSFLQAWTKKSAPERDWESVGVSLNLALKGVDILRVHEPVHHMRAYQSFQETRP